MTTRPSAAFAAGLAIGAALALGVAAFSWRPWQLDHSSPSPGLIASLQSKDEEIHRLQQQVTGLSIEVQQLRRSVVESKSNLNAQAAAESSRPIRRVPFRRPTAEPLPATQQWIVNAVLRADTGALAELEEAATRNNSLALEGLALLADRDNGAALMRVWGSEKLSESNRVQATRLIAATIELHSDGWAWLRNLVVTPNVDRQLLIAAMAGLANPTYPSRLQGHDQRMDPSPRFAVDVTTRLRAFDSIRVAFSGERTSEPLDRMRADLAALTSPSAQ